MSQAHYRTCNLCEAMCGVVIHTEEGLEGEGVRITSVKGDQNDPFSRGHICAKAIALKTLQEDPDRLRYPMKRTTDGWQEISWQQAFDEVEQGIKAVQAKYGRHAVGFYVGNPTVHNLGATLFVPPLMAALHSKNKFSATSVDQLPHMLAALQMFGHQLLLPIPDVDNTDFMLMLGANPAASNGSLMTGGDIMGRIKGIQQRGGRVVVLDPRRTETAQQVGEHIFIKPASDVYFLAALLHVLFKETTLNKAAIEQQALGLEMLELAVESFSPERVATVTGIEAAVIRQLAHDFAKAERAVCYGRMGVCTQEFGGVSAWLINAINVVTGNLDKVGGALFNHPAVDLVGLTSSSPALRGSFNRYQSRVRGLPEFNGELPVAVLAEEILTEGKGQIKALITHAGNPVLSTPNGQQVDQALASLDFMVAIDIYLNETTRHAHIILPPTGVLEHGHYDLVFNILAVRNVSKYSPPLLTPPDNTRHDWQILLELAARFNANNAKEKWLWQGIKRIVERLQPEGILDLLLQLGPYGQLPLGLTPVAAQSSQLLIKALNAFPPTHGVARQLKQLLTATPLNGKAQGLSLAKLKANPHGLDLGALQPSLAERICTPDRKVILAPHLYLAELSRAFTQLNAHQRREPNQFLLIGRRHIRSNNSWLHNSLPLIKGKNRCTAMMNQADASALAVNEGDMIRVKSRVGDITLPVEIVDDMMTGVISIPHGFGHHRQGTQLSIAEGKAGVSMNDITDEHYVDGISGTAALNGLAVTVLPMTAKTKAKKSKQIDVLN
ncbi:molybdopterin-dependent oxidoreductase [Agitococcus lubricus]|uniref:Anaerobic selenocysteine-containing dehydrogenase n=1 Tax=Agitococcus lubricus TaxID=1077255 RepID=A0A2T5J0R9_9GAMM|nr:molybdopterin-dependent oxidoreductase [Agitococcus lubricus]PTQ89988.1 anaerobic selenocysteine-containing dehydrogenase [Agitococcus lubricus]